MRSARSDRRLVSCAMNCADGLPPVVSALVEMPLHASLCPRVAPAGAARHQGHLRSSPATPSWKRSATVSTTAASLPPPSPLPSLHCRLATADSHQHGSLPSVDARG